MGIFLTNGRTSYRRWVSVIPNLFLPGSTQYMAGKKRAGILWFLVNMFLHIVTLIVLGAPFTDSNMPFWIVQAVSVSLHIATIAEGCRYNLPRVGVKSWVALVVLTGMIMLAPLLLIRQFCLQPFAIPTGSMEPTLMGNRMGEDGEIIRGDRLFVNKWNYHFHEPKRGDLVVFSTAGIEESERGRWRIPNNVYYIRRLVGLPGETVSIQPPYVYINGKPLTEPPIFQTISSSSNGYAGYVSEVFLGAQHEDIVLGADEYYVLGDNSRKSMDSRFFGPISRRSIIGKVGWIYWPVERRGTPK